MPHTRLIPRGAWLLLAALSLACARDVSTPSEIPLQFAKGGGKGGGGSSGGPAVDAADPNRAERNTVLDVRILGSGFDAGSRVSFALNGVESTKVVATTTTFVSPTELIANVTVAADADTLEYDVVVLTAAGKKGIGSELFAVIGDPTATWLLPLDDSDLSFRSDRMYPTGDGYSAYENDVCGVAAKIFATPTASNSGDATIQTDRPAYRDRNCASFPRKVSFHYPDGVTETLTLSANLHEVQNTIYSIAVGQTVLRGLNLGTYAKGSRCGTLRFKPLTNTGEPIVGDEVLVTRIDHSTWEVRSQDYPNNRVNCRDTGETFHMSVRFRVMTAWPLP